ncbi:MAG: hypothetical protein AAFO07_15915 [Bacteroidota bacterium]
MKLRTAHFFNIYLACHVLCFSVLSFLYLFVDDGGTTYQYWYNYPAVFGVSTMISMGLAIIMTIGISLILLLIGGILKLTDYF